MSAVNIYDEAETIISSDDYSEEDDDDLMNTAISSQIYLKAQSCFEYPENCNPNKNKELEVKLFIKRKKIGALYKKKSIKWLNGKEKRDKYKKYLLAIINRSSSITENLKTISSGLSSQLNDILKNVKYKEAQNLLSGDNNNIVKDIPLIADVALPNINLNNEITVRSVQCTQQTQANIPNLSTSDKNTQTKINNSNFDTSAKHSIETQTNITEFSTEGGVTLEKAHKRPRSPSPSPKLTNHVNTTDEKCLASNVISNSTFFKEMNTLFPTYDEIQDKRLKSIPNTENPMRECRSQTVLELRKLAEIIKAKELEWNKLVHLQKVKEEFLRRLERKLKALEIKQKYDRNYTLPELKELESILLNSSASANKSSSAKNLIESRANMKREDLNQVLDFNTTNRLQSLLMSTQILPKSTEFENRLPNSTLSQIQRDESNKCFEKIENKMDHQRHFNSFEQNKISNFHPNIPEILRPVSKRFNYNEKISTGRGRSYVSTPISELRNCTEAEKIDLGDVQYTPRLEEILKTYSNKNTNHQSEQLNNDSYVASRHYKVHFEESEDFNEITVLPISSYVNQNKGNMSDSPKVAFNTEQNYIISGEVDQKRQHNNEVENHVFQTNADESCRKCRKNLALFLCAGCENQWYCSRNCQIRNTNNSSTKVASEGIKKKQYRPRVGSLLGPYKNKSLSHQNSTQDFLHNHKLKKVAKSKICKTQIENNIDDSAMHVNKRAKPICHDYTADSARSSQKLAASNLVSDLYSRELKYEADDTKLIDIMQPRCCFCQQKEGIYICAQCENQWYCSQQCQVTDWAEHVKICSTT